MLESNPVAFTISEAVAASRVSRSELYRAMARGDLAAKKNGRKTLILREELTRFLATLPDFLEVA